MELLGLSVASKVLHGGIQGTTATIRHLMGGGFLGAVALFAIFVGIIGTNTLDDYTGSLSLQTAGLRILRPLTAGVSAVLSFLVSLWFIYGDEDLPSKAQNFLLVLSYWITAWLGIVAVDWFRRRGRVDVDVLDHERGLHNGFAALIAMLAGVLCALPLSNTTMGYNFITGHPHASFLDYLLGKFAIDHFHGADVGFLSGFIVAALLYAVLDRRTGANVRYLPLGTSR
jgi:NCS1 family nucleobase:cation symporter-1